MKRLLISSIALCAALSVSACSKKTDPSPTSTAPKFIATLNQANEFPAISNADGAASGTSTITLNTTTNAGGAITAATADFTVVLTGFPANTTLTGAHIHPGRPGTSGGVIVGLPIAAGEFVLANGSVTFSKNGVNVDPAVAQNMLNDPIGFYFNVHTTLSQGGAIRGPLVRQ